MDLADIITGRKKREVLNPLMFSVTFLYPLKTSEKHRFSDVFRGYKNLTLDINGLIETKSIVITKIISLLERKTNFIKRILQRKDRHLTLVLSTNGWSMHVYSKELSGGDLCKACVLFDKSTTNRGIFVKYVF